MLDIFSYQFMQRAFIVGILVAITISLIGVVVVFKRYAMLGDTLAHNSLAGVGLAFIIGLNPIIGAIIFSLLASFSVEFIKNKLPKYNELAIAIIMAFGIGMAALFSSFVPVSNFSSFLFGSIVVISDLELLLTIILAIIVVLIMYFLYKEIFYITFDSARASLAGIRVNIINFILTLMIAIVISISSRTVGILIVSSLMTLPVASSILIAKSYKTTIIYSIMFSNFFVLVGLFLSYYLDLKPGGVIVMIGIITFIIINFIKYLRRI